MSASTWGDPNATRRVLMIHGIIGSSHTWHRIALEFTSRGYFVIAPDLLGHGNARRGSDYSIVALADELRPYFATAESRHYHIVLGFSLGGLVVSALLPLLESSHFVRVVLIDPPLELTSEAVAFFKTYFSHAVTNPKTPEEYQQEWPLCTREDAIFASLSVRLCDVAAVEAIFDQNVPWTFSHHLSRIPGNVRVSVLAGDPSKGAVTKEDDLKLFPDVTSKTVLGVSHLIPIEAPQVIIETALQGAESQPGN